LIRGFSSTTGFFRDNYDEQVAQPRDTVLSLAISRASYGLVKRLIDQGADVQSKNWYHRNHNGLLDAQDVTVLHIGSSYWNVEGIKALLDHGGSNLVSSFDSEQRLPIH
jgi:chitinase